MRARLSRVALLVVALAVWWVGFRPLVGWVEDVSGFDHIGSKAVQTIVGHWLVWQLPGTLLCVAVWLIGARLGLMPSFLGSLGAGGSVRRVVVTGLTASAVLLVITVVLGVAGGGKFGFHPYVPKMVGDLVSNLYEEIVHRGLMFCAFYGVATGVTFPLDGALDRVGLVVAIIGSCVVFAGGHGQYAISIRIIVGVVAIVFAWPWARARSLWAPWIPHTIGDIVGDTILTV